MHRRQTSRTIERGMRIALRLLVAGAFIALASCASALPRPSPPPATHPERRLDRAAMDAELRRLLADTALARAFVGIRIMALDDSALLFDANGRKLFHPASNLKLLTTAAALHRLPAAYRFTTAATAAGEIRDGTLRGDLVIRGGGDPLLSPGDLDSLAGMISRAGIRAIEGDLAGDVSRFDSIAWGRGWMWDDEPSSDFAYVTPLSVSHNAVEIRVAPGAKTGHEPALSVAPATEGLVMFNTAVTTADTLVPPLTADRLHGTNTFRVAGRIAPGDTAERLEVSVWQPERWCLELLRERLAARGVSVRGACTIWTTPPPGFDTIASVSRSLDTVLAAVNKESDNLAAELLLKTIAAESGRRPGTSAAGIAIVKEYLAGVGVDTSAVQMADGSGVSFYNEVSPEALLGLLQAEYSQPATFARFRASLPVAGVDGTLRGRMKGTRAQGNAAAKTGTLTGVSTISGYLTSADGRPVAFCILASHFPGPAGAVRALQNEIIALLAQTEIGPRR